MGVGWGTISLSFIWVEVASVLTLNRIGSLVLHMGVGGRNTAINSVDQPLHFAGGGAVILDGEKDI